jgi:hypothetical protein
MIRFSRQARGNDQITPCVDRWEQCPFRRTYASAASKIFRHSGITPAFETAFEIFTRVGPDNSLERLTERGVGLVTDRPRNVNELFVTLFE